MDPRITRRTVLAASLALGVASAAMSQQPAQAEESDDFELLRERWEITMTGGSDYDPGSPEIAARIAGITQTAQAWWDSMNTSPGRTYLWADSDDPQGTPPDKTRSYTHLAEMALAYATHGSPLAGNAALGEEIVAAMQWLYDHAYNESMSQSGNWWDWQIGVPLKLLDTLTLMPEVFTAEQRATFLRPVEKFPKISGQTGANLLWIAQIYARTGSFLHKGEPIVTARDSISEALPYVTSGDGFYADGSFIQHKTVAYNGGYGLSLLSDVSRLVGLFRGTRWEVVDPQIENLYRWVYDGFEPFVWHGSLMALVCGREISRNYATAHVKGHGVITAVLRTLTSAPEADAENLKGMVKAWVTQDTYRDYFEHAGIPEIVAATAIVADADIAPRETPSQYHQFAAMDRAVQRRPRWAFGLSMSSDRIGTHESINDENLRGWYTGEGMTYLYNGDLSHYAEEFWPTVDPYRLPGTTVDTQQRADGSGNVWVHDEREAGGTELGGVGTSAMKIRAYDSSLTARKSWFAFDDEIVALGAGITAEDGRTIETCVENRKLPRSEGAQLTVDGTATEANLGWHDTLDGVTTVHLHGDMAGSDIGYYFPGGATIQGLCESRTGSWRDIDGREVAPTDPITATYLTLWYDHGIDPVDASYSYALLPGMSADEVMSYGEEPGFSVVANSAAAQAVRHHASGVTAAQLWQEGSVAGISADARASVITETTDETLRIAVSDPSQHHPGTITVGFDLAARSVVALDERVRVTQLTPTVELVVEVANARGVTVVAELSMSAPTSVPEAPELDEAEVVDGELRLSWDFALQAAGYLVQYGTVSGDYAASVDVGPATEFIVPEVVWGETLYYTVTAYNALGSGEPAPEAAVTPLYRIAIDNADTSAVIEGDWAAGAKDGQYGSDYLHDGNTGRGSKSVTFTASDLPPGDYQVSAWWVEHPNRATAVPYAITHSGGTDTVHRNQRTGGSAWNALGVFTFDGGSGEVVLSNTGANGYVVADAVQFAQVSPQQGKLELVAPLDAGAPDRQTFEPAEQILATYLVLVAPLANSVVDDDPATYGWMADGWWRSPNHPRNSRIMEHVATLSWFLVHERDWNPYLGDPALAARLDAAIGYYLGLQGPRGAWPVTYEEESLATTGFGSVALAATYRNLKQGGYLTHRLDQIEAALRHAADWLLDLDLRHWQPPIPVTNQIVGGLAGVNDAATVLEDPALGERVMDRLEFLWEHGHAPAGHTFEPLGYDWGYSFTVALPDFADLALKTSSPVPLQFAESMADFFQYAVLWEPDGSGALHFSALSVRNPAWDYVPRVDDEADRSALGRAFLDQVPSLAACHPSIEAKRAMRRAWADDPDPVELPPKGQTSPRTWMHTPRAAECPTETQRQTAMAGMRPTAEERFTELRLGEQETLGQHYLFLRRPGYYLGALHGKRPNGYDRQRSGNGLLWHPRGGMFLWSMNDWSGASWSTYLTSMPAHWSSHSAAGELQAEYFDGVDHDAPPLGLDEVTGKLGVLTVVASGTAASPDPQHRTRTTCWPAGLEQTVTTGGEAVQSLPIVLHPDDEVAFDDGTRYDYRSTVTHDCRWLTVRRGEVTLLLWWGPVRSVTIEPMDQPLLNDSREQHTIRITHPGELRLESTFIDGDQLTEAFAVSADATTPGQIAIQVTNLTGEAADVRVVTGAGAVTSNGIADRATAYCQLVIPKGTPMPTSARVLVKTARGAYTRTLQLVP